MILIAPTAFKATLDAAEASAAMAAGARRAARDGEVRTLPVSDGGPGLIDALRAARGGGVERVRVTGPLGQPVTATVLRAGELAVVESADACGLHLVPPDRRDPLRTTTYGVGQLIAAAAGRGGVRSDAGGVRSDRAGQGGGRAAAVRRIVVGLGGSGTVDGGAGMAQALGWRLLDGDGRPIGRGGGGLASLARIEPPGARTGRADAPAPPDSSGAPARLPPVTALADVTNPLLGDDGAARVFGPQKGADAAAVRRLESALAGLAERLRVDLGVDVRELRGGGAAGGLGAAVVAFLDAELAPGADWVLDAVGFDAALSRAALVVTGEGAFDAQSAMGKVVGRVIRRARAADVPVLLVAGAVEAAPPGGVTAVDGAGERLTAERIEALVAEHAPRLLA